MLLHSYKTTTDPFERTTKTTLQLEVGRTLAVTILGVALVIGAVVLWLNGSETPAAGVFALGEAVITGGLGIVVGESAAADPVKP